MGTVEGAHNYYGFGTPDGDSSRGGSLAVGLYFELIRHWESGGDLKQSQTRFFDNSEAWIREASGVKYAPYEEYDIDTDSAGVCTLRAPGYAEPLREVYNPNGSKAHLWLEYRKTALNHRRHTIEHQAFVAFEEHLAEQIAAGTLREGNTYVWVSPPPTDILLNAHLSDEQKKTELKKHGYDFHSCTFVFTVKDGKLETGFIQNYLHPVEHARLIAAISDVNTGLSEDEVELQFPHDLTLLSTIHQVKNISLASPEALCEYIDALCAATPAHRRIKQTKELVDVEPVDHILDEIAPMLSFAFYALMHLRPSDIRDARMRGRVMKAFEMWRKSYQELSKGRALPKKAETFLEWLKAADEGEIQVSAQEYVRCGLSEGQAYQDTPLQAVVAYSHIRMENMATDCGDEVGWGMEWGSELGVVPSYHAVQLRLEKEAYERAEAKKALRRIRVDSDERISKTKCSGCNTFPTFSVREVQDKCELQCTCRKRNSCMTDPCGLMKLILESAPAPVAASESIVKAA